MAQDQIILGAGVIPVGSFGLYAGGLPLGCKGIQVYMVAFPPVGTAPAIPGVSVIVQYGSSTPAALGVEPFSFQPWNQMGVPPSANSASGIAPTTLFFGLRAPAVLSPLAAPGTPVVAVVNWHFTSAMTCPVYYEVRAVFDPTELETSWPIYPQYTLDIGGVVVAASGGKVALVAGIAGQSIRLRRARLSLSATAATAVAWAESVTGDRHGSFQLSTLGPYEFEWGDGDQGFPLTVGNGLDFLNFGSAATSPIFGLLAFDQY